MPSPSDQTGRAVTPCPQCRTADVKAVAFASNFVYLRCSACALLFVIEDRRSFVRSEDPRPNAHMMASPAVAAPKCPACDSELVRFLPSLSDRTYADYYRCLCGHVWSVNKETRELIQHVTPLPDKPHAPPPK